VDAVNTWHGFGDWVYHICYDADQLAVDPDALRAQAAKAS
jgi:hypothetical protein